MSTNTNPTGFVHIEFWGEKTAAELFLACCQAATALGLHIQATHNVTNLPGGDESSFDFDIIGECSPDAFACLCNGLRDRGMRVKEAQLGDEDAEEIERLDEENEYDEPNDDMDGDHASALASAGWGTDEDYGYYGDEGDDW